MKIKYVYINPKAENKIEAVYTNKPVSKEWGKRGYILKIVPAEWDPFTTDSLKLDADKNPAEILKNSHPAPLPEPHPLQDKKFADLKEDEKDGLLLELLTIAGMITEDEKVK